MVLGIIITVGIASIIGLIIIKLIRSSNKTGYLGKTTQCISCGRKTNSLFCLDDQSQAMIPGIKISTTYILITSSTASDNAAGMK